MLSDKEHIYAIYRQKKVRLEFEFRVETLSSSQMKETCTVKQ